MTLTQTFTANIESIDKALAEKDAEISRLRAENTRLLADAVELKLKNDNLSYWIRSRIQAN